MGGDLEALIFRREKDAEAVFIDRFHVGFVGADDSLLHDSPDGVVHELHSLALAPDDDVLELLGGPFADDRGGGVIDDEDFIDGDPSATSFGGFFEEQLGDHSPEGTRQHGADLRLLIARKDIDHPVDGFAGVIGVERAENEHPGFGGGEGELDGFEVAHFSDEDDIRVFAEGGF